MTDHAPAFCLNRPLSALLPTGPLQLRPHPMRVQRVNGQRLHEAKDRIESVFCVEQSFASIVAVADTDGNLLRTAAVPLVEDDELTHLIHGMAGIRQRVSRKLLIALTD